MKHTPRKIPGADSTVDSTGGTNHHAKVRSTPPNLPTSVGARVAGQRFTSLRVKDVLKIRLKELGLKNTALQQVLGYARPNVIAMMKKGGMKLPANKVIDAARLLEIDPVFLLGKVIAESDPELWAMISSLLGGQLVSANELKLIEFVRRALDGHDVDLISSPSLTIALSRELQIILDSENALVKAALASQD
jgi:hypothetical protein